jgi:hypothetical protein
VFSIYLHPISTKNKGSRDVDDDDDNSPLACAPSKLQTKASAESVVLIICRGL